MLTNIRIDLSSPKLLTRIRIIVRRIRTAHVCYSPVSYFGGVFSTHWGLVTFAIARESQVSFSKA